MLLEVAELIELSAGDPFRGRAFKRSAKIILDLSEPVEELLAFSRFKNVRGIGEGTIERVKCLLRTGTFPEREKLKARVPRGLRSLLQLRGLGAKTVRLLWQNLRVENVEQLVAAVESGSVLQVRGIGPKTQAVLVDAIGHHHKKKHRISLELALELGQELVEFCRGIPEVIRAEQCGSARRRKRTVGDLDILIASDEGDIVLAKFCTHHWVRQVLLRGKSRASVRLDVGIQVDLRVVALETFGAGLHYFTGSQAHNIAIRTLANRRGLAINEHGVFRKARDRRGASDVRVGWARREMDVFRAVGLDFIPPELRENGDEIEAAQKNILPALVDVQDLRVRFSLRRRDVLPEKKNGQKGTLWAQPLSQEGLAFKDTPHKILIVDAADAMEKLKETSASDFFGIYLEDVVDNELPEFFWKKLVEKILQNKWSLLFSLDCSQLPDEQTLRHIVKRRLVLGFLHEDDPKIDTRSQELFLNAFRRAWCTRAQLLNAFTDSELGFTTTTEPEKQAMGAAYFAFPLRDEVKKRLEAYLRGEQDENLEHTLASEVSGDAHPLQKAFALLHAK
ncbi:MAG: hypothetical protein GY822_32470 [Deltaproteobacteria bacterium]|nr:hypothetical protein [Deltaproteobacteria bacterium]